MNRFLSCATLALALLGAGAPAWVQAASPGTMQVFDPNGSVYREVTGSDPLTIYYLNLPVDFADPDALFDDYTVLAHPDTGMLTDMFGVTEGGPNGGLDLAFARDLAQIIGPGNIVLTNTGAPFDASQYLNASLRAAGWTASYTPSAIAAVPEPASYVLMGLGLLGGAVLARVRRS
jgi:hypothetical protein